MSRTKEAKNVGAHLHTVVLYVRNAGHDSGRLLYQVRVAVVGVSTVRLIKVRHLRGYVLHGSDYGILRPLQFSHRGYGTSSYRIPPDPNRSISSRVVIVCSHASSSSSSTEGGTFAIVLRSEEEDREGGDVCVIQSGGGGGCGGKTCQIVRGEMRGVDG